MNYKFMHRGQVYDVRLERAEPEGAYRVQIDGEPYEVEVLDAQPGQISLRFGGRPVTLYWAQDGAEKWASAGGCAYKIEKPAARRVPHASEGGAESVRAPMPASVRAVQVAEGDAVEKGQTLLLLEAMKMEIRVKAPSAGMVARVLVAQGQTVDKEQALVELSV